MKKIIKVILVIMIFESCQKNETVKIEDIDAIQLRSDYFTSKNEYALITDKKIIKEIFDKTNSFKDTTCEQVKPFKGSISLSFIYYDRDGGKSNFERLETSIIIKENNNLLISNYNGNFRDDVFVNRIIWLFKHSKRDRY